MHHLLRTLALLFFSFVSPTVYAQQAAIPDQIVLDLINKEAFLTIRYSPDVRDHWQTPKESHQLRSGDCEDYAIYKLFRSLQNGVAPSKLRMLYVRATLTGSTESVPHMVLGYYTDPDSTDPLILDNLIGTIRPLSQRRDLQSVFSFNSTNVWLPDSSLTNRDPRQLFPNWADVLYRTYQEGFPAF